MTLIKKESGKTPMPEERTDSPPSGGEPVAAGGDGLKKGPWTSMEDAILMEYVKKHGDGNWNNVQKFSGLSRCGKSCRLRWANHLRPNLKKGTITPEEERKIIQMHSQMGNKWARMAALLPGRTDNEIKNFWNTRMKRCERTGVPLYPDDVQFDPSNHNLRSQDVTNFGSIDKQYNEVMQGSTYGIIPEIVFENYKTDSGIPSYRSCFPNISASTQGFGSRSPGFVDPSGNHLRRLSENETFLPGFQGSLHGFNGSSHYGGLPTCQQLPTWPAENVNQAFALTGSFDPESSIMNPTPLGIVDPGSHALNGNFPSSRPLSGSAKLELPSFQNTDMEISNWIVCPSSPLPDVDNFIHSPSAASLSPRNNGLLESLLPQVLSGSKNQESLPELTPSNMLENSVLNHGEANWGDHEDPITPLGLTSDSVFSETPPFGGSPSDEFLFSQATPGSEPMLAGSEHSSTPSFDELGSEWYNESYGGAKGRYMLNDVIASLLAGEMCSEDKQQPSGTAAASLPTVQGLGSECFPASNMAPSNERPGTA